MESGGIEIRGGARLISYSFGSAPHVPDALISTAGLSILEANVLVACDLRLESHFVLLRHARVLSQNGTRAKMDTAYFVVPDAS